MPLPGFDSLPGPGITVLGARPRARAVPVESFWRRVSRVPSRLHDTLASGMRALISRDPRCRVVRQGEGGDT